MHVQYLQLTFNIKISETVICAMASESVLVYYIHLKSDLSSNTEKVRMTKEKKNKNQKNKTKKKHNNFASVSALTIKKIIEGVPCII